MILVSPSAFTTHKYLQPQCDFTKPAHTVKTTKLWLNHFNIQLLFPFYMTPFTNCIVLSFTQNALTGLQFHYYIKTLEMVTITLTQGKDRLESLQVTSYLQKAGYLVLFSLEVLHMPPGLRIDSYQQAV